MLTTLIFKSRAVRSQWIFLLRAFFPNWKFFDIVGHVPHLMARSAHASDDGQLIWTDWRLIYPRRNRRWRHLFHNPDVNLALAQQNLVDHFWSDLYELPEGDDPRRLATYAMVERLALAALTDQQQTYSHWQFELRMILDGPEGVCDAYVMMRSPVNPCFPATAC